MNVPSVYKILSYTCTNQNILLYFELYFMIETKSKRGQVQPKRWTTPERKLVTSAFKEHIASGELPKKHECEEFLRTNAATMGKRSWTNVKDFVRNLEQKMNKRL